MKQNFRNGKLRICYAMPMQILTVCIGAMEKIERYSVSFKEQSRGSAGIESVDINVIKIFNIQNNLY